MIKGSGLQFTVRVGMMFMAGAFGLIGIALGLWLGIRKVRAVGSR